MTKSSILVVEDDKDINDLLCDHLSSKGYRVTSSFSSDDAKNLIAEQIFDLYILDWMLPGLTGIELCQVIRTSSHTVDSPIIILTALSDSESIVRGLDAGANDYVTKPFDLQVLLARVRSQLRSINDSSKNTLEYKDLILDKLSFEAHIKNQALKLTKSEFLMLKAFLEKANTVFSRKELITLVQGDQTFVTDRTIDTHIASLRKKIEPYATQIKTIRGIGYKFEI